MCAGLHQGLQVALNKQIRFYVRGLRGCTNNTQEPIKNKSRSPRAGSSLREAAWEATQWPGGDRILSLFCVEQTKLKFVLESGEVPETTNKQHQ